MSIRFEKVSHIYNEKTIFEHIGISGIDLQLAQGKITAIIGATGSGKTTLVQHLNGLLLPSSGLIEVLDHKIEAKKKLKDVKKLRKEVGMVFQFAEYQLFEENLLKDVAFGPRNFGVDEQSAYNLAASALATVGISQDDFLKSPLELSGGQKRKVAIAGILAMMPSVLVLDEPTAGLDPASAKNMMDLFYKLNKEKSITVIIVTHNMDHVLDYCDEVVVLEKGKLLVQQEKNQFFKNDTYMQKAKIDPPAIISFKQMCQKFGVNLSENILDIDSLVQAIKRYK